MQTDPPLIVAVGRDVAVARAVSSVCCDSVPRPEDWGGGLENPV